MFMFLGGGRKPEYPERRGSVTVEKHTCLQSPQKGVQCIQCQHFLCWVQLTTKFLLACPSKAWLRLFCSHAGFFCLQNIPGKLAVGLDYTNVLFLFCCCWLKHVTQVKFINGNLFVSQTWSFELVGCFQLCDVQSSFTAKDNLLLFVSVLFQASTGPEITEWLFICVCACIYRCEHFYSPWRNCLSNSLVTEYWVE